MAYRRFVGSIGRGFAAYRSFVDCAGDMVHLASLDDQSQLEAMDCTSAYRVERSQFSAICLARYELIASHAVSGTKQSLSWRVHLPRRFNIIDHQTNLVWGLCHGQFHGFILHDSVYSWNNSHLAAIAAHLWNLLCDLHAGLSRSLCRYLSPAQHDALRVGIVPCVHRFAFDR